MNRRVCVCVYTGNRQMLFMFTVVTDVCVRTLCVTTMGRCVLVGNVSDYSFRLISLNSPIVLVKGEVCNFIRR